MLFALSAVLTIASSDAAEPIIVKSPDGSVAVSFEINGDDLTYAINRGEKTIIPPSQIEVFTDAAMAVTGHQTQTHDSVWEPVYGQFRSIRDHYNELTLSLTAGRVPVELICRVFDTGVGLRFVMSEESRGRKISYQTVHRLPNVAAAHNGSRGGKIPNLKTSRRISVPLVVQRSDNVHVAILESDLYSAAGFESLRMKYSSSHRGVVASNVAVSQGAGHLTPWRVVLIGDTAGALTVNTVALNLAAPCQIDDTDWIVPGKGLWDWRIHGYHNGDFAYGIDTRSYLRLIDFCAENEIEYLTVDDFWFEHAGNGKMKVSPKVDIAKVMQYAKEHGVRIMLYYDRKKGNFGDETLFEHYAQLGASGIKYGFMGNKATFTRESINAAAENKLLINFHDGPVPMTGVQRTMPNLISREYCHGQQDARKAFTPETFLNMAMVSGLTGPLDMSNGNFGINSINAGEREKGPKERNTYISTVVSEVARNLVINTGLVTLPDAPEEYCKKTDLFDFLRDMPATWDDTRVPNSKLGEYITVARRSGQTWFIASVGDQNQRDLNIPLDFLSPGIRYQATVFSDGPDAHGVTNPEAYEITSTTVNKSDIVTVRLAVGGGNAIILRPIE
ncbi:alpha-glucosidase [Rhodopirellula sallentina SM41]|uniref:Alpha-glucosidase n=1 Tax=Rhodopirellula sallentina SM41 TaxID=1263870 RepID=M5U358_9BACT|nr:alpha-glucosidase [Rhodopirellula sallentina SM41]